LFNQQKLIPVKQSHTQTTRSVDLNTAKSQQLSNS